MLGQRILRTEHRAATGQATAWGTWGDLVDQSLMGSGTWSGAHVTTTNALQLLAVYGCNRFICEGISTLPIGSFRSKADGTREETPKPVWIEQPTADLDRVAWLTQVLTSLLLDGNCYLRLAFDQSARLQELVPLDPTKVHVRRNDRTKRKEFLVNGRPADAGTILHIPAVMFPGSETGLSPVEAARQTIGQGMSAKEFAGRFFGQGANLSGVIEVPGELLPEKAKELATRWSRRHSGNRKAHLPGVLDQGASWKATGVTPEQAQFLGTQAFNTAEIAAFLFLIDPTEFGFNGEKGSSLTYANLEQRNARKVQVTFLPWMVRIERALSLLLPKPQFLRFNASGLLRGDTKTRYETYQIASAINVQAQATGQPPLLLTTEMRDFEDMEPIAPEDIPTPPPPPPVPVPAAADPAGAVDAPAAD